MQLPGFQTIDQEMISGFGSPALNPRERTKTWILLFRRLLISVFPIMLILARASLTMLFSEGSDRKGGKHQGKTAHILARVSP
jgi:hypothetical protein